MRKETFAKMLINDSLELIEKSESQLDEINREEKRLQKRSWTIAVVVLAVTIFSVLLYAYFDLIPLTVLW